MREKTKTQDWRKGPARHLLRLFQEGLNVLDAYLTERKNIEIVYDRQPVSHHIKGSVNYDFAIQTYQNLDVCLSQLGSFVRAGEIPRKNFERLVYQRNVLVRLCENKREFQLGVVA